jgi:hypothetical protein
MKALFLMLVTFGLLAAYSNPSIAKEPFHNATAAVYSTATPGQVAVTPVRWPIYYGPQARYWNRGYYPPYRAYYGYARPYWYRPYWDRAYYYPRAYYYGYPYGADYGYFYFGPRASYGFEF